jgi:hypothetical protein
LIGSGPASHRGRKKPLMVFDLRKGDALAALGARQVAALCLPSAHFGPVRL